MLIKIKSLLLFTITLTVFYACQQITKPIIIDNPTDKEIVVVLDNKNTIKIDANEKKEVDIKYGDREISIDGIDLGIIKLEKENDYILNPTKSNYYKHTILFFASSGAKRDYEKFSYDTIVIDGYTFKGEYEKYIKQLLIINDFKWGLDQPVSELMGFTGKSSIYRLNKLYRESELVNEYNDIFHKSIEEMSVKFKNNIDITKDSIYVIGNYIFDYTKLTLILDDSKKLLKQEEADILYYFAKSQNELINISYLQRNSWGTDKSYAGLELSDIINQLKKYLSKDNRIEFEKTQVDRHTYYYKLKCCNEK